ncbi:hypothetical protein CPLU01_12028 [Colletotrichum plurivorum]|uniref:Uncharacterized protein n=1 Tax=Colletotrichum plurivorum TaxID=2175906 RepID=A0A8H6JZN2_9PEZI|nr:hypothetical protein CPLU01_12028 [Colletotrichum plurivorum]
MVNYAGNPHNSLSNGRLQTDLRNSQLKKPSYLTLNTTTQPSFTVTSTMKNFILVLATMAAMAAAAPMPLTDDIWKEPGSYSVEQNLESSNTWDRAENHGHIVPKTTPKGPASKPETLVWKPPKPPAQPENPGKPDMPNGPSSPPEMPVWKPSESPVQPEIPGKSDPSSSPETPGWKPPADPAFQPDLPKEAPGKRSSPGWPVDPSAKPDYTVKQPDYTVKQPDYTVKQPDYTVKQPDYPVKQPDYPVKQPDYPVKRPDNPVKQPDYHY